MSAPFVKKIFNTLLTIALFGIFSCQNNIPSSSEIKEVSASLIPENAISVDFASHFYPLTMYVPDSSRGDVVISSENDVLDIRVGDIFHMSIGYGGDLANKKSELQDDLLYKYEMVNEADSVLIYAQILPDNSNKFYHFYALRKIDGELYEIQDVSEEQAFSKKRIEKMVEFIKTIRSNKAV